MMCLDKASKISHLLIGTYVINNPHHIGSPVAVTVGCFGCVYSLYCRADFSYYNYAPHFSLCCAEAGA